MKRNRTAYLAEASLIAALYVVLTTVFSGFSFGQFQVRISEALCVLPYFTSAAVPGLFAGCLVGNLISGAVPADVIFGSLTTLTAAFLSRMLASPKVASRISNNKWLVPIPPIVLNALIVPLILKFGYGLNLPYMLNLVTIGAGELISCMGLGMLLLFSLNKHKHTIFKSSL